MFLRLVSALALVLYSALPLLGATGIFTLEVGGSVNPQPPAPLVRHGDIWHYRPGTNAPQTDWKTASSNLLDSTWLTGPGGFGFEDNDDATVLTNMFNGYTTLYIRRQFDLPSTPGTNQRLHLIMDWDDGFVAWLDGNYIARSSNAPGAPGTEPAFNAVSLAPNHEASAGPGGNPPTVYDLGPAANLLEPGTHILAVMGLNGAINSSDFSLIADLQLVDSSSPPSTTNPHYSLVTSSTALLSGTNTVPGAARVFVDGRQATFSAAQGTWHRSHPLNPGLNRLFVASLDSRGNILASIRRDIIFESSTTFAGGTLPAGAVWSSGIVRVTNNLVIPAGVTLDIGPGVVVLLSPAASITANGTVTANGTEADPVFFLPASGATWGSLVASGAGASLAVRHAEIVGGQIRPINGGAALVEDSVVRDLPDPARELFAGVSGSGITVRRSLITRFTEVDARDTPVLIEDSLLQDFLVDGVDIKTTTGVPLIVRNTTLRFGNPTNSNADAIDFGPGAGTVERCLIHHFPDKGVSMGGAPGSRVYGSVIYDCGIGLSADASTGVVLDNNTVANCQNGLFIRNNSTGTGTNLIVWDNARNIIVSNASSFNLSYSDVQGGFPGDGNISSDPLFLDASARDYRLDASSPARGSGFAGADMGAVFPVGGIPDVPEMLAAHEAGPGSILLTWLEDSDNEQSFLVQRSVDGTIWADVGSTGPNTTRFLDSGLASPPVRYYYRVASTNSSGKSHWSNMAPGTPGEAPVLETFVGGTLTTHATWTPAMGMIIVRSNLIVPTNIVLTIEAGATVKLTNNVAIRATAGGVINILGDETNKVTISNWNPLSAFRELSANGTNASLYIRHADISGLQTTVYNAATGLIEDSKFHNYRIAGSTLTQPIVLSQFAKLMTFRRCHVATYYETLFRNGVIVVEDCLFEDISGDGLDFDGAQPGSALRRSTFRNGTLGNVDAVDVGPAELGGCKDLVIEDCVMYNFPFDKGVSVGDNGTSTNTIVRNCLIYDCLSGVMAKDNCDVTVYNCTIVENSWGFTNYNKVNPGAPTGGGHTFAFNNILWDNGITISMWNSGTLTAAFCDLGNTNWPGTGNINADPLFLDAAARDYRLASNSPCINAGSNGVAMGVTFPVGGVPAQPLSLVIVTNHGSQVLLAWTDDSNNESGFIIEASTNAINWTVVASAPANASNALASTSAGVHFRVRATNFIGSSFASNTAAITGPPGDTDGDGMPDSWENTYSFNLADPADASQDADGDGQSNLSEYRSGTHPRDAASKLGFNSVTRVGPDQVELIFTAQAGKAYEIHYRDSLASGGWITLTNVDPDAQRPYTFTDTLPPNTATRFYRLIIP